MTTIEQISADLAENLCRKIIATLPEYFGLPEVNEHYANSVKSCHNFAVKVKDEYVGLISINFPYPNNCNIYWMAISPAFHNQGIGTKLIEACTSFARSNGANTLSVETLAPTQADSNYLKTYHFYESVGFAPLFNLKPDGYEWNMVYMVKFINDDNTKLSHKNISITLLNKSDISLIVAAFANTGWNKPLSTFESYFTEQEKQERVVWIASIDDKLAGYITLKWMSQYESFAQNNIPEIMDLNVLPQFRKFGVGTKLLEIAEVEASTKSEQVGLGVGLYGGNDGGYGAAQKLYISRGYKLDGKGATYKYKYVIPGATYSIDDNFVLWLIKKINHKP